jgi:hypothetical protein
MTAEIDRRVEELASRQLGLFAVRQVLLLQGTMRVIEHRRDVRRWRHVRRGVLALLGTPDSYDRRVLAEILAARGPTVASHRCSARLAGLPGVPELLEFTSAGTAQVRRTGVVHHRSTRLATSHVEVRGGIPVTTVARTLFDLSAVVRAARVARALDTALARRLVTIVDLTKVARDLRARGRRKVSVIRALLRERGRDFVAPHSELEAEPVDLLTDFELPQPSRQVNLGDDLAWIGRVDFVYRRARIVIEADSREHHSSLLDRRADAARDAALTAAGWIVLRFTWWDVVHDRRRTVAIIRGSGRVGVVQASFAACLDWRSVQRASTWATSASWSVPLSSRWVATARRCSSVAWAFIRAVASARSSPRPSSRSRRTASGASTTMTTS